MTEEIKLVEAQPVDTVAKIENKENGDYITSILPSAGKLVISPEQEEILFSPVNWEDVEIRPDGLVYLPWMEYASRLTKAFLTSWCLISQGNPFKMDDLILWKHSLVIDGIYMGTAYGEQAYYPSNPTMTYGDALEGAVSNALMRLCKRIGISLELWKPSFVKEWKEKHAEKYYDKDKKKYLWRRKEKKVVTQGEKKQDFDPLPNTGQTHGKIDEAKLASLKEKIDKDKLVEEIMNIIPKLPMSKMPKWPKPCTIQRTEEELIKMLDDVKLRISKLAYEPDHEREPELGDLGKPSTDDFLGD